MTPARARSGGVEPVSSDEQPAAVKPRLPLIGRVFAVVAFVEAATWAALLIGMFLKYVTRTTELAVQIAGSLHGYAFLVYLAVTIAAAIMLRWRWGTITLAVLAAIPPLATIPLEVWMRRTGRLARRRAKSDAA